MVGAILTILCITAEMGGIREWWPATWSANWGDQPLFSPSPYVRVTAIGSIISFGLWSICTAAADQVAIQRYLATRDAKAARRAFLVSQGANVLVWVLLSLVGFAVLGFFKAHPEYLKAGRTLAQSADDLFPRYIANHLPIGLAGLVVAAMMSAAMSSLDSGINSIITVVTTDFLARFRRPDRPKRDYLGLAKVLTLVIGIAIVLVSSQMGKVPGNIMEVTGKTDALCTGPLFGLFLFALFVRFVSAPAAIIGTLAGLAAAIAWGYWDKLTGLEGLSFQWIIAIALLVQLAVGCLVSLAAPRKDRLSPDR